MLIILTQLVDFLRRKIALCERQHGFASGKSTLTNALTCDKTRADTILKGHAVNLLSFDFKSAFDKAPYSSIKKQTYNISAFCSSYISAPW